MPEKVGAVICVIGLGADMDLYFRADFPGGLKYGTAGVREYWIVDLAKERITVYNFENESAEEYTFSDKIIAGIYEDFEIDFGKISFI